MSIRYIAILMILIKFVSLDDGPLIVGQALIAIFFSIYFILAGVYFIKSKNSDNP